MTTDFRIHLVTWNVGETNPPKDLVKVLGLDGNLLQPLPNLYAIGLQEMKSTTASRVSDLVFEDTWTAAITDCLAKKNYVRIKVRRLLGMLITVFVRRVDLPYITNVESEHTRTGLGGLWGNKGAVGIRLDAYGVNVCFVNSHFAAHAEQFHQRLEDYNLALETQRFRDKDCETILDHDYVFWMGDLNFRIEGLSNEEVRTRAMDKDFKYLSSYDQLTNAMKEELIFVDFLEGPIKFPPTFKFDVGTDVYDTSTKNRVPSYCDRILWRVHEDSYEGVELSVDQLSYGCVMSERSSDHKPVYAEFIIQVLKAAPELPVMFEPMSVWCQQKDNEVSYLVSSSLTINSRDWIGLYREGYKNWTNYMTYVWASGKGEDMHDGSHMHVVSFESRYLQRLPSDTYYLLYFSFVKNCVVGYSDGFRLSMTEESMSSSSSEGEEVTSHLQADVTDSLRGFSANNNSFNPSKNRIDELDEDVQGESEEETKKQRELEEDEGKQEVWKAVGAENYDELMNELLESEEEEEEVKQVVEESCQSVKPEARGLDDLLQDMLDFGQRGFGDDALVVKEDEQVPAEEEELKIREERDEQDALEVAAEGVAVKMSEAVMSELLQTVSCELRQNEPSGMRDEQPVLTKDTVLAESPSLLTEEPVLNEPKKESPLLTEQLVTNELKKLALDESESPLLTETVLNEPKKPVLTEPSDSVLAESQFNEPNELTITEEIRPQSSVVTSEEIARDLPQLESDMLEQPAPAESKEPESKTPMLTQLQPLLLTDSMLSESKPEDLMAEPQTLNRTVQSKNREAEELEDYKMEEPAVSEIQSQSEHQVHQVLKHLEVQSEEQLKLLSNEQHQMVDEHQKVLSEQQHQVQSEQKCLEQQQQQHLLRSELNKEDVKSKQSDTADEDKKKTESRSNSSDPVLTATQEIQPVLPDFASSDPDMHLEAADDNSNHPLSTSERNPAHDTSETSTDLPVTSSHQIV